MHQPIPEPSSPEAASGSPGLPTPPLESRRFAPDRLAFFQRIAEGNVRDREVAAVVRAHLAALENRIARAVQAAELGHLGSARAFLEIGRRDYDAALNALPRIMKSDPSPHPELPLFSPTPNPHQEEIPASTAMEKTPLELAQEAFAEWLQLIDDMLQDAELSFEEFTGAGLRRELQVAGEALARAEGSVRRARAVLAAGLLENV